MSLWTCHPLHYVLAFALWGIAWFSGFLKLEQVQMLSGVAGVMAIINGLLGLAYYAAQQNERGMHPFVWWTAIPLVLIFHLLAYGFSLDNARQRADMAIVAAVMSIFASMQLSFLWQHRPILNPKLPIDKR